MAILQFALGTLLPSQSAPIILVYQRGMIFF